MAISCSFEGRMAFVLIPVQVGLHIPVVYFDFSRGTVVDVHKVKDSPSSYYSLLPAS